jgi:hypothetical protein
VIGASNATLGRGLLVGATVSCVGACGGTIAEQPYDAGPADAGGGIDGAVIPDAALLPDTAISQDASDDGDAGSPPRVISTLASMQADPSLCGIAVDATNVYFGKQGVLWSGAVMKVPLGGGSPTTLVSGLQRPCAFAIDTTRLYWADVGGSQADGTVKSVPLAGGTPTDARKRRGLSGRPRRRCKLRLLEHREHG